MPDRNWEKDWEMCEKATPGPWKADDKQLWHRGKSYDDPDDPHVYLGEVADWCEQCKANLRFIAEAREALPSYLQRVKELEEVLDRCLQELKAECYDSCGGEKDFDTCRDECCHTRRAIFLILGTLNKGAKNNA